MSANAIATAIKILENRFSHINSYIFRFDLGIMILLIHPESNKFLLLSPLQSEKDSINVELVDFKLDFYYKNEDRVNISLLLSVKEKDGFSQILDHSFNDISLKAYQVQFVINP